MIYNEGAEYLLESIEKELGTDLDSVLINYIRKCLNLINSTNELVYILPYKFTAIDKIIKTLPKVTPTSQNRLDILDKFKKDNLDTACKLKTHMFIKDALL